MNRDTISHLRLKARVKDFKNMSKTLPSNRIRFVSLFAFPCTYMTILMVWAISPLRTHRSSIPRQKSKFRHAEKPDKD